MKSLYALNYFEFVTLAAEQSPAKKKSFKEQIGIYGVPSEFKYGDLISNIIEFIIIALLVFLAYKVLSKYILVEDKSIPEEKK